MSDLTVEIVKKVMPGRLRGAITQELVDKINTISTDPILTDEIKKNFLGYTGILQDGKYKTEDYLNAVVYVSYKLMGYSDDFKKVCSVAEQYKQIGNSVCVPMIYELAKEIKNQFFGGNKSET